jgi:hypothetical protein
MGLVSVGRGVRLAAGHMLDIYTGIRILLSFWQKKDKERFDYFGAGVRNLDGDMDCVLSVSDRIFCQQIVISEEPASIFGSGEEQNIGNTGTVFLANLCIASTSVIWGLLAP